MTLRAALSLALLVLGLPGQAADGTAQARLDEAKEAMVDAALSQPTRVRSAAWIDESGVLHEQTRFQSQGGIRGIRMPSYLPKDATQKSEGEPAGPMLAAEPVAAAAAPSPANAADEDACPALPGLMQSAVLVLEPRTPPGAWASGYARTLEAEISRLLARRFNGEPGWHLASRHTVSSLRSPYEQAVYDGPKNRRPLQLTLAIAVREAATSSAWWAVGTRALSPLRNSFGPFRRQTAALAVDLELRLSAPREDAFLWTGYDSFSLAARDSDGSPRVRPADVQRIYATLNTWFEGLEARQSCTSPRFAVVREEQGQLVVNGGHQAGLRVGDKLLLADGLRTPEDVLERGVDDTMALAEILWAEQEEAGLRLLSGTSPQGIASLVAVPL